MKIICKNCSEQILPENINIQEGIFFCSACNEAFKISSVLGDVDKVKRVKKPNYSLVEIYSNSESLGIIIPSHGLKGATIFFLIFSLFWNGMTWPMFLSSMLAGNGLQTLFFIPFILIGLLVFGIFLFFWKGIFTLMLDRHECSLIWSVFNYKFKRTLRTSEISDVYEDEVYSSNNRPVYGVSIVSKTDKSFKFGSSLKDEEIEWCIGEIRHFLKI